MISDKVEIYINETGAKTVRRNLDDIANSAENSNRRLTGLNSGLNETTRINNLLATSVKTLAAGYAAMRVLEPIIRLTSQYQTALVGVSKTTGLVGKDLDNFSKRINSISKQLPISTAELLELSQAAGQMGVTGAENLEKFSLTVAKLGRASDLAGEEAAKSLARILNVTGEAVDKIDVLASVIVSLGNNSAASESEIARMTTEIARATGVFGVTSAQAAAMGAAMASIGIQAELGGSAVGRSMQTIANAVEGGDQKLRKFAGALGINADELKRLFEQDRTKAFELFLRSVGELGLGAGAALKGVGLGGQEIAKTIVPLANNMDIFTKSMNLANAEVANATALNKEFDATLKTLDSQWQKTKNIAESFARSLGNIILPVVNSALAKFNEFASTTEHGGILWFFDELGSRIGKSFSQKDPISAQVDKITELQKKLDSLKSYEVKEGSPALLPGQREFRRTKQAIDEAINGLAKLAPAIEKTQVVSKETEKETKKLNNSVSETGKTFSKTSSIVKKSSDEGKNFITALQAEASQLGKNTFELKRLQAEKLGILDKAGPLIEALEKESKAFEKQRAAATKLQDDLRKIKELNSSVATNQEKFDVAKEELDRLKKLGLSQETYTRALKKTKDELFSTKKIGRDSFDQLNQFAIQGARNIQTAFADFFFDPVGKGLKGLVSNFANAIRRMIAEAAALKVLQSSGLGQVLGLQTSGVGGSSRKSTSLDILGLGSSVLNLTKGGFGLSGVAGGALTSIGGRLGIPALAEFGAGLAGTAAATGAGVFSAAGGAGTAFIGGAGTAIGGAGVGGAATLGASLSAMAGPLAIAAIADIGLKAIFGDKKLGGTAGDVLSYIPIVGTLINGLFGRGPLKFQNQTLQGTVTSEGLQSSALIDSFKAQGGVFRSSKRDNIIIDTQNGKLLNQFGDFQEGGLSSGLDNVVTQRTKDALEIGKLLNESFSEISKSLESTADILGISKEGLKGFNAELKITSEKGEALSEAQISGEIERIANQMVKALIPSIDTLSKNGEKASETLARLGQDFATLEGALILMGNSAKDAQEFLKGTTFEQRSAITDKFGGAAGLESELQGFFNSIFTNAQKLPIVEQQILKVLTPFNIDFVPTLEQLYQAFTSGNPTLIQAALAVDDLVLSFDQLKNVAIEEAKRKNAESVQSANRIGSEKFNLETQLLTIQGNTLELRRRELAATEPSNRALKLRIWLLEDEKIKNQQLATIRRDELAVRREIDNKEQERLKALKTAREELEREVSNLREGFLLAGDAAGYLNNELKLNTTQRTGTAGEFNATLAAEIAKLSTQAVNRASENALQVQNVGSFINTMLGNITSSELIKPIYLSVRDAISEGSDIIAGAVGKFAQVFASEQVRSSGAPRGRGIASVISAQNDFSFTSFSGFARGKFQTGKDVVEFGKALDNLDKQLESGKITSTQHAQAVDGLNSVMGENVKLLNNYEAQIERLNTSAQALFAAGIDSIGFYFNQISNATKELNEQASAANEPLSEVNESIGRLNSLAQVMRVSVGAVITGLKNSGQFGADRAGVLSGSVQQAAIIGEAAAIASSVITTLDASKFANQLSGSAAFAGSSQAQIKGVSLLLDGLKAFDSNSFEKTFLRLNDAFIKGVLTQEQYEALFNLSLDTFEGLNGEIGGVTSEFQKLREASKRLADELLVDQSLTSLNPNQTFTEAQRQFSETVNLARQGDSNAISNLSGSARTLLSLGRTLQDQGSYNALFGRTVAILRGLESAGGGRRADFVDVVDKLDEVKKELSEMKSRIDAGNTANATSNSKTAKILDKWDVLGMPEIR